MELRRLFDLTALTEREACGDTDDQSLDLSVCAKGLKVDGDSPTNRHEPSWQHRTS